MLKFALMKKIGFIVLVISLFASLALKAADTTTTTKVDPKKIEAEQKKVQSMLDKFVTSLNKDPKAYTILVEGNDVLNAYATIGKKIVVFTGLIDSLKNQSALAFVVAHELGHIEERHSINGMVRTGVLSLIGAAFFKEKTVASNVYGAAANLGSLHYSRGAEKEADMFAVAIMNKLYCNVPGKLEFFEKNAANQKSPKIAEYFSTHPLDTTRIEYLKKAITDAGCKA
jgi:predicted Zn-dependent protease